MRKHNARYCRYASTFATRRATTFRTGASARPLIWLPMRHHVALFARNRAPGGANGVAFFSPRQMLELGMGGAEAAPMP
jgi:hypothetical protein